MMGVETNVSGLGMGYHGVNNSMNLEHDNEPIIGAGFGAADEYELERSRGDVFLDVGIDIEMGSSGYGMHQTPTFHQSGRQQPEHPHLYGHSPHQSHPQHDLDIISLLNESSFDTSSTLSMSNSKNGHQTSPLTSHKRSTDHNGIVPPHSSQPREVYVGLSDYGMGSLINGDHTGMSPTGIHLSRGLPANLGIGIVASP